MILSIVPAALNTGGVISSAPRISSILTNFLQFLLMIVGAIAIIGLVIAGLLYFFAEGNEKQVRLAKKAVMASVAGVIIALGGIILIRTLAQFL